MKKPSRWGVYAVIVIAALGAVVVAAVVFSGTGGRPHNRRRVGARPTPRPARQPADSGAGIHKIKHVVVIIQENRSFDSYFGTFPGADGIPAKSGRSTVCVPDPQHGRCVRPYHDPAERNGGGPHELLPARLDIHGGRMDGFIAQAESAIGRGCGALRGCETLRAQDVMGYHDAREIPNYWTYAKNFVLDDHMFEPVASWSLPDHLFQVSEWSARCSRLGDPGSCANDPQLGGFRSQQLGVPGTPEAVAPAATRPRPLYRCLLSHGFPNWRRARTGRHRRRFLAVLHTCRGRAYQRMLRGRNYAWTDLTYLLHAKHVSWRYYVKAGGEPDCADGDRNCTPRSQNALTPAIWNPLPSFSDVKADHQLGNVQAVSRFYRAARRGKLPAVAWVVPNDKVSEHPPATPAAGQTWVTGLINTVMRGPDWGSTAIFLAWDDWGGFYDHLRPPKVDRNGYGIRVPGLVISPYSRRGYIDHQTLSLDAFNKFIEDDLLGGARIDPASDGRPDPRPDVRERARQLGDLSRDFDFNQPPRPPLILPTRPPPGAPSSPGG